MLVEVKPNSSYKAVESVKKTLIAANSTLQFNSAYTYEGERGYPTNQIIISLKPNSSIVQVNTLFGSQYVSATKNQFGDSYLLTLKDVKDLFSLTESIHQSGLVEWATPNLISGSLLISNPLYPAQYYLNNTGQNGGIADVDINAPEAWAFTANACIANPRVRVAVIDDGVEEHEDLNNLLPIGYDARDPSNPGRPLSPELGHGQACAGIIGADDNGVGIRGVATNVEILPIKIYSYGMDIILGDPGPLSYNATEIAQSIEWAWNPLGGNADVLSCSWGGGMPNTAITTAIQNARTLGRGNKGCIVVFASGNGGGRVLYPGNLPNVITVGAIDKNGTLFNYSSRGAEMDLVAPSGERNYLPNGLLAGDVITLDRMGASGYNTAGNYTGFGGTSAACPQVAGVAALMLQVNPNLTETQVRTILQQTARDLGTPGFDNDTGYGLVNAEAAVNAVPIANLSNVSISGLSTFCNGGSVTYRFSQILPAGATITWKVIGDISLIGGQGTPIANVSAFGNGAATIQATITNCGVSYPIPAFNIFVNLPPGLEVNYIYNNGSRIPVDLSSTNNLCLGYTSRGYLVATVSPSSSVTFTAISGLTIAYRDGRSAYFTLLPGASVGRVRVFATNPCGTDTQAMAFQIANCGIPNYPGDPNPTDPCNNPPRLYNISPNPATFGQIKIGTAERPMEVVCPVYSPKINAMNAVINSKDGITFSEVNIYNSFGMLVLSKLTNKAKEFVIPLNELRAGLYLVQISEGEHTERHQIIIE